MVTPISTTANKEQLNRWKKGKLDLHETGKLTDKEDKLEDSLSLNKCQNVKLTFPSL